MLNDDKFLYIKIPKALGSALIKAILQAAISCKHDSRSSPKRLDSAEYILLQFANELGNSDKIGDGSATILSSVFESEENSTSEDSTS